VEGMIVDMAQHRSGPDAAQVSAIVMVDEGGEPC